MVSRDFLSKQRKSSFSSSDRPEIYSNGYQICFDVQNGSIGYILPDWLVEWKSRRVNFSTWTTRICLPLKSETEMQKHKSRSLTAEFQWSSSIAFIILESSSFDHRLIIVRQTPNKSSKDSIFPERISSKYIAETTIEKWLVSAKSNWAIPEEIRINLDQAYRRSNRNRPGVSSTWNHEKNGEIQCIKQDVYAYLPLRTFGLTFIIQADFEVPSSRQDILGDSLWNQFLTEWNACSVSLITRCLSTEKVRLYLSIHFVYFFIFFPMKPAIYSTHLFTSSLPENPSLPYVHIDSFRWWTMIICIIPNECILVNDVTLKEILTPEILYHHFHLYYLTRWISRNMKINCMNLGVHRLDHQQLIEIIKRIFTLDITFDNKRPFFAKWFSCLYRYLNELSLHDEEQVLKHIQLLKIFPLKNRPEFDCIEGF